MTPDHLPLWLLLVLVLTLAARLSGKIDTMGALAGAFICLILLLGTGILGLVLIGSFFVLGTLASIWKMQEKTQLGVAEKRQGMRGVANVLSNAAVPGLIGLLGVFDTAYQNWITIIVSASFASATSDTLSSEFGSLYGRRFFNITTLQPWERGKDGAISVEGVLAGFIGSVVIAAIYFIFYQNITHFIIISLSGVIGNLLDSVLGATLQNRRILNNHTVNFFNTLGAALIAWWLLYITV